MRRTDKDMATNDRVSSDTVSVSSMSKKHKRKKFGFSFKSKKISSGEFLISDQDGSMHTHKEEVISEEETRHYNQEGGMVERRELRTESEVVYQKDNISDEGLEGSLPNLGRIGAEVEKDNTDRHSPSDSSNHSNSPVRHKEKFRRLRNATFSHFSHRKPKIMEYYQGVTHRLKVRLLSGQNLAARDKNGLSDPYVKFKLHGSTVHKSHICYANLNPKWDREEFTVSVRKSDEMVVKVYDKDTLSKDDFMGMSSFELDSLEEDEEIELSLELEEDGFVTDEDLGRIHIAVTLTSIFECPTTEHDGPVPSSDAIETMSVSSLKFQEQQQSMSRSDSNASLASNLKGHSSDMRLRKMKTPLGSVHITLVSGTGLPARDSNGLSDPYVKFQFGKQKHKSQVCFKTLDPVWKEEVYFMLTGQDSTNKEQSTIDISVWDKDSYRKDDFIGRCELELKDLQYDTTYERSLSLTDTAGTIKLLVTMQLNRPTTYEPVMAPADLTAKYALASTFNSLSDVGFVEVKVIRASGCRSADPNGKSDPLCIVELCNARAQTHTCYKTLDPVWNKTVVFPVKDIHDILVFTVMDEDRDKISDFLGKVTLPLLRVVNGVEKTYAFKDKKLQFQAKGSLTVEVRLIYNKVRAAVRTFSPREERYNAPEPKFKRQLLTGNFSRLWSCIQAVLGVGEFVNSCFTWESPARSSAAFLVYILFVWNVELYMIPILLLLLLVRNYYHIVHKKNAVTRGDYEDNKKFHDDYEDEETEDSSKPSLIQRLKSVEETLLKVQNILDWLASLLERIHNTFAWSVPYLTTLAGIVLSVVTVVLYFVPLRVIALLWGLNKFTKRLRKPNYVANNELLDFLSRVPSHVELDELQDRTPLHTSPKNSKKKRC